LVAATSREFSAPDGTSVQGWVLRDPEAATPAPTLLDIHGGPHNAWAPVFDLYHLYHQTLAAAGWTIVYINPRGSDGYGEAFFQDVVRGWGLSDESDFHAALDELVAEGVADPSRLAVTGYSYGGFMTCWLTSTGDRFGAAVAGGSVVNLESEFGTSDMGWYLGVHEIGGLPTDEGDAYDRMSPIALAARASTPTLILHGEADQRCPVSQAEEWFAALRARRVPCQLVRYPGASHLFIISGRPSHRIDYARRLSDWVQAYTSGPVVARPLAGRLAGYQSRLDALAVRYRVPGAQLAVLDGDEIVSLATGVVDRDSAGPVTTETRFQIGSITKLFTATLMMQLVDRGLIDLDAPVTTYLPEFRTLSGSDAITIRHLLTHTNGIPGDRFVDTGPGEDAIARYVDGLAEVELVHPVGAMFSYSNAAFVVAGRVIEVVTGLTYDAALRSAIVDPLGLSLRTVTDEIILGSHALGHTGTGVAPVFALARGMTPAGSTPAATARDLVTFARMHLEDGAGVLSPASVKAMQERQVSLPPGTLLDGEGIAWGLSEWDGELVIGHNGGTLGQYSFLTVLPDRRLAIALLTNGPTGPRLAVDVNRDLFTELAGVTPRRPPEPPAEPVTLDLSVYTGEYVHAGARTTVFVEDGVLTARIESLLDVPGVPPAPPVTVPLTALDRQTFLVADEATLCFLEFDSSGRPAYLFNGRVAPRVG
jgi:CubicO group peptidase (beta-lactamase class C family)/predicted esterase